jgi:hypothetical protein
MVPVTVIVHSVIELLLLDIGNIFDPNPLNPTNDQVPIPIFVDGLVVAEFQV